MKNGNHTTGYFLIIALAITMLLLTACPKPQSGDNQVPVAGQNQANQSMEETSESANEPFFVNIPVEINVSLGKREQQRVDETSGVSYPEMMVFNVEVNNLIPPEGEEFGINFVYESVVPTGEFTYMLKNPADPELGYIEDENGPIIYDVVETVTKKIESPPTTNQFAILVPENTYKIRYWIEVVVPGGRGEENLIETPYVTIDDIIQQGGPITEIPE